jgi:hypothetical protein
MRLLITTLVVLIPGTLPAAEKDKTKRNTLTPKEAAEGWISLFDGQTTFGWKTEGNIKVADGALIIGGGKKSSVVSTAGFEDYDLCFESLQEGKGQFHPGWKARKRASLQHAAISGGWGTWAFSIRGSQDWEQHKYTDSAGGGGGGSRKAVVPHPWGASQVVLGVDPDCTVKLRNIKLRPVGLKSIFNGKDLTGWKEIPGKKSKFSVTSEGWLNVKNGPGDLQTQGQWKDFVLQIDVFSNGKHLNSGVFFRCIPGKFWSGYEAQIRNQWQGNDRTKPVDYGTGAIYNRQPARKVVSNDREWFTMTVAAQGKHLAVWVNGYQTADFTDPRPLSDNARKGCKVAAGPISLQGHDPTTDLSFRNIRIAELPGEPTKGKETRPPGR